VQKRKQGQRLTPSKKANVLEKLNQWLSNPEINKPSRNQLAKKLEVSSRLLGNMIAKPIDSTPSKQALSGSTRRLLAEVLQLVDISGLPTTLSYMAPRHAAFSKLTKNAYGMFKREALERRVQNQVTEPMPPTQEEVQKLEMVVSPLHFVTQNQENPNSSIWLVLLRPSGVLLHYVIRENDQEAFGYFIIDVIRLFKPIEIEKIIFLTDMNNEFPEYPPRIGRNFRVYLENHKDIFNKSCSQFKKLKNIKMPSVDFKNNPYKYAKEVIHLPLEDSTITKASSILESLCQSYNSNEFMKGKSGWITDKNRSPRDNLRKYLYLYPYDIPEETAFQPYWEILNSIMHRPIPNSRIGLK
jgi:hypothetical protein